MAHFLGELKGQRGATSRLGSKTSGIQAHIRGWNVGVKISLQHNATTGSDEIHVYRTGGSNNAEPNLLVGILRDKGDTIINKQKRK